MGEEIKTILTADSSPMRREYEKAAQVVRGYTAKVEQSRARVRQSMQAEISALDSQRQGHEWLAKKIRESNALKEETIRLARRAGISEAEALQHLRKRAELEREVARQQQQAATRRGASYLGTDLQDLDRLRFMQREVARGFQQTGHSAQRGAMGVLEISRAVEDAQYGFRGVINNVPGIVQSFGGGMGLAGAVSLAVVAFYQLGKAYMSWLEKIDGNQAIEAYAAAWERVYEQQMKSVRSGRAAVAMAREVATYLDAGRAAVDTVFGNVLIGGATGRQIADLNAFERELEIKRQLAAAEAELAEVKGGKAADARKQELRDMREELHRREELAKTAQAEYARLIAAEEEYQQTMKGDTAERQAENDKLKGLVAQKEAEVAATQAAIEAEKNIRQQGILKENLRIHERDLAVLKDKLEESNAFLDAQKQAAEAGAAAAEKARQDFEAEIDANVEKRRQLKEQIALKERLAEIQREITQATWEEEAIKSGGKLAGDMARELKRMQAEREKAAKEEDQRNRSRAGFAAELIALRLEVDGKQEMADAVRREAKFREDAVRLARELGIEEQRALQLLRQKYELEQRAEDRAAGAAFGGGRGGARGPSFAGGGVVGARGLRGQVLGFRESEMQRRSRERALRPRQPERGNGEELLARQLTVQENLLKVWQTIQKK